MNTASLPPELASADDVLAFWLGAARPDDATALAHSSAWFRSSAALDAQMRTRFGSTVEAALQGRLQDWAAGSAWDWLALLLLLDQFTRNIHRGTAHSFAGDAQALALAQQGLARQRDQSLPPVVRIFCYLPLEHAESAPLQQASVAAFTVLAAQAGAHNREFLAMTLDYARRHQAVVAQFGRFPHRNALLGRASTPAEQAYLAQPGAGF